MDRDVVWLLDILNPLRLDLPQEHGCRVQDLAAGTRTACTDQQNPILRLLRNSDRALALREIRSLTGQQTKKRRLREDFAILKSKGLVRSTGRGRVARWNPL